MFIKKIIVLLALSTLSINASASFIQLFKFDDGRTNWQYIANFSSGVLIILLFFAALFLLFTLIKSRKLNNELRLIKANLEARVKERTLTLDKSNQLLKNANQLLEGEITEHKQTSSLLVASEAYIKSILDSMPISLIGLSKDLAVTQWNRFATETTGIDTNTVMGKNLWDIYPSITLSPEQVQKVFDTGETLTIKHSQRGQYYFDITVYLLKGNNDTGLVILIDDVTHQSKAENLLIQKDKFSSMGELAAGMAYDINIPLNAIRKASQQLDVNVEVGSPNFKAIKAINSSSQQAFDIVKHLLDFSNSESQTKELASIPQIMDHSLDVASRMFKDVQGFSFSQLTIEKLYESDVADIPCHVSELQLVFITLIRHACIAFSLKDNGQDQPKLTIEINNFYDSLWVKIQHNGLGLNTDEQQTIFEPFYQDQNVFENGCDLENRLSFPYFIISDHHGGQMSVTSDVNVGSTFHIQLLLR